MAKTWRTRLTTLWMGSLSSTGVSGPRLWFDRANIALKRSSVAAYIIFSFVVRKSGRSCNLISHPCRYTGQRPICRRSLSKAMPK